MRIVLLKKVKGLGEKWDVKEVADGYARNVLIRQGLAAFATGALLQESQEHKKASEKRDIYSLEATSKLASLLEGERIDIVAKANEKGELYAAVTEKQILSELLKKGYRISKKAINLSAPIKHVGDHSVSVSLKGGERPSLTVSIGIE